MGMVEARSLEEIQHYLYTHIPITRHMEVHVLHYDGETIRLTAPLRPNINHRNTVFGGSIATLGILANWTLLHLRLEETGQPFRLVIQKSMVDFIEPIDDDFEVEASLPNTEEWERFWKILTRKKKSRLITRSVLKLRQKTVAVHEGAYVAILP
jgi:thioesterase domain-containing protein